MAIIDGLRRYSVSSSSLNRRDGRVVPNSVLPEHLFYLINPFENYAAYQQQFDAQPGIPYLLPHIKEAGRAPEGNQEFLRELFQKVLSSAAHS